MHVHAKTFTVKVSDRYISRVSIDRIPVKENQSFKGFGISVHQSVPTAQSNMIGNTDPSRSQGIEAVKELQSFS